MAGRILTTALIALGLFLYRIGAAPLVRRIGRNNPKVLLYHDCSAVEDAYVAGLDCTTSPENFANHLTYIRQHYTVIDLETLIAGQAPPGAVAITFDDGYRSVYEQAYPLLRAANLPATVYLIADVVGNEVLVWVNELNHALRMHPASAVALAQTWFAPPEGSSPAEVVSHCRVQFDADRMRGLLDGIRLALGREGAAHAREARLYVDWSQVAEMENGGVTFGNHTCTHPNMERLSPAEQEREILEANAKIAPHVSLVHSFAHPFGHRGSVAAEAAAAAGARCVTEVGGGNRPVEPLRIGRVHISNQDVAGLFARMEVVEPVKERLRRLVARRATSPAGAPSL